jgi:CHAT domain-containing protein
MLNQADSLFDKKNYKLAFELYEKIFDAYPDSLPEKMRIRNRVVYCKLLTASPDVIEEKLLENLNLSNNYADDLLKAEAMANLGYFYLPALGVKPKLRESEDYLTQAAAIYANYPNQIERYLFCRYLRAILLRDKGDFEVSERLFLECRDIRKKHFSTTDNAYAILLANLAQLYHLSRRYKETEQLNLEVLKIKKALFGENHVEYAISLNNMGLLYFDLERFVEAERCYRVSMEIYKVKLGDKHLRYSTALSNLATLYKEVGNLVYAKSLFDEAHHIYVLQGDTNSVSYANSLQRIGGISALIGRYDSAMVAFQKSSEIIKEFYGDKHFYYASSVSNIASVALNTGNYYNAEKLYLSILKICKESNVNLNTELIVRENLTKVYYRTGRYADALEQIGLIINKSNTKHYEYLVKAMCEYKMTNDKQAFLREFNNFVKKQKQTVIGTFNFLSEKERSLMFETLISKNSDLFESVLIAEHTSPYSLEKVYNWQLFSKSLLLHASKKLKNKILQSKDTTLINLYKELEDNTRSLIKEQNSPSNTVEQTKLIDSMENRIQAIERELGRKSNYFTKNQEKDFSWRNIQKALKKDEAAIEIVRINKFGIEKIVTDSSDVEKAPNFPKYPVYGLTDTVYYAALIVKKKSKQPEIVLLKNGNDLEKKFVNYQKNAILYKREDAISYNEFWKPIAEKLKGIKKVYFSPDGVYNQISLNTLQNPETKKYVLEEIELHLVTNTKDILAFGKSENKSFKADLLGYPIYDLQTENADESRKRELEADTTRAFANFQKVNLLPGTKKEVEDISKILKSKNYQLEVLTEKNATEENIKQVKSPKILHLSTHGFFIDSKEKNEKINPMLRSGLLLTGVSDYTRAEIKPDTEDGVLTALEAANLDLDETDLVVLSACETGLGDVKAGEGVYGLQRAFKVAGAKTIVMSMWKVDDAVTQKLMTTFYQKFAENNNARKAFKEAQAEIKKQYPEPYFWGAFVMTGE